MRSIGVQMTQENAVRIAMGADHGGFDLKNELAAHLKTSGHDVVDLGAHAYDAGEIGRASCRERV